jgi:hypothetical protein
VISTLAGRGLGRRAVAVDDVLDAALDLLGLRNREPAPPSPDVA